MIFLPCLILFIWLLNTLFYWNVFVSAESFVCVAGRFIIQWSLMTWNLKTKYKYWRIDWAGVQSLIKMLKELYWVWTRCGKYTLSSIVHSIKQMELSAKTNKIAFLPVMFTTSFKERFGAVNWPIQFPSVLQRSLLTTVFCCGTVAWILSTSI